MPRNSRNSRPRKSPEQIALANAAKRRQDFEAVGLSPQAADQAANADIEVTRAGEGRGAQKAGHDGARRMDAFEALRATFKPGGYDAARRLERDIRVRRGEGDRGARNERLDGDEPELDHVDRIRSAGERIDFVMARLSQHEGWLLTELVIGHPDRPLWRQSVDHITGEGNANSQGARVRAAVENLREAYEAWERRPPERRRAA